MGGMIANPERQTNHLRHALPGPDLAAEAVGFGATVQQVGQPRQLLGHHPVRPGWWPMAQRLRAAHAGSLQPLADGSYADAERFGDVPLPPAFLQELPGLQAACFFPVVRCWVHAWQTTTCASARLGFYARVSNTLGEMPLP